MSPKGKPCKAYIVLLGSGFTGLCSTLRLWKVCEQKWEDINHQDLSPEKLSVDVLKIHHYLVLNCHMAYSCVTIRKCETDDKFIFGRWSVLLVLIQILYNRKNDLTDIFKTVCKKCCVGVGWFDWPQNKSSIRQATLEEAALSTKAGCVFTKSPSKICFLTAHKVWSHMKPLLRNSSTDSFGHIYWVKPQIWSVDWCYRSCKTTSLSTPLLGTDQWLNASWQSCQELTHCHSRLQSLRLSSETHPHHSQWPRI